MNILSSVSHSSVLSKLLQCRFSEGSSSCSLRVTRSRRKRKGQQSQAQGTAAVIGDCLSSEADSVYDLRVFGVLMHVLVSLARKVRRSFPEDIQYSVHTVSRTSHIIS